MIEPTLTPALLESLIAREIEDRIRIYSTAPTRLILDTSDMPALRARFGARLITGSMFDADIKALPFADDTFAATIGIHLLEQLDGKELANVLAECARLAPVNIWVLRAELLRGNILRSTQNYNGSYTTEIGGDWLIRTLTTWSGTWNLRGDRFRLCPGGILVFWKEQEQFSPCSA